MESQRFTFVINYDQVHLTGNSPSFVLSYTHGFDLAKTHFDFDKIDFGVQQPVRLAPKCSLYFSLNFGKVFGTIPYLLLNIPVGNDFYVASRFAFYTMSPYEFVADRYIDLHTRLSLGGLIFDKIPYLQKLGWRERISFNLYWGDMTDANVEYNKNQNYYQIGNQHFVEVGWGIENIFHVFYFEFYKRFTHLNNPFAINGGIFLGVHLSF